MPGWKTFIIKVNEWDFSNADGTPDYVPTEREAANMARPFVVQAEDDVAAMNKLSDRLGWCIVDCEISLAGN